MKELNFGSGEGQRWDEIQDPRLQEWYDDWLSMPAGGAESFLEQYNRVSAFLDDLKETEYGKVCVFAHGGTIRAALIYAGKYNFNQAFTDDVDYGSLMKMTIYGLFFFFQFFADASFNSQDEDDDQHDDNHADPRLV